jgi:putative AlgH/UPF0301 family transcriptional regulator
VLFILLFFALNKTAWGPMLEGLQKREENIRRAIDEAEAASLKSQKLQSELDVNSWLVSDASLDLVFKTDADTLWKKSIAALGQQFNTLLHMPTNPALN